MQWEQFLPRPGFVSKNFHARPGCRQKSSLRISGVGSKSQMLKKFAVLGGEAGF